MRNQSNGFLFCFLMFVFTLMNIPLLVESKGSGGWPSTTGNPSGGGRNNGPRGK